jgi:hypothetical protein
MDWLKGVHELMHEKRENKVDQTKEPQKKPHILPVYAGQRSQYAPTVNYLTLTTKLMKEEIWLKECEMKSAKFS